MEWKAWHVIALSCVLAAGIAVVVVLALEDEEPEPLSVVLLNGTCIEADDVDSFYSTWKVQTTGGDLVYVPRESVASVYPGHRCAELADN